MLRWAEYARNHFSNAPLIGHRPNSRIGFCPGCVLLAELLTFPKHTYDFATNR